MRVYHQNIEFSGKGEILCIRSSDTLWLTSFEFENQIQTVNYFVMKDT
jgi:hypothetical protein